MLRTTHADSLAQQWWNEGGHWFTRKLQLDGSKVAEKLGRNQRILLMEELLHQLIGNLYHCLQGFWHPRWCRISAINSSIDVSIVCHLAFQVTFRKAEWAPLYFRLTCIARESWGFWNFVSDIWWNTLPETNSLHLKRDGWKTILSYWVSVYFQGQAVSFREGIIQYQCAFEPQCQNHRSSWSLDNTCGGFVHGCTILYRCVMLFDFVCSIFFKTVVAL